MAQSHIRLSGMDGHTDTLAVAYVAHDQGAAVTSRDTLGTRPCDSAHLRRTRQAKATPLIFV